MAGRADFLSERSSLRLALTTVVITVLSTGLGVVIAKGGLSVVVGLMAGPCLLIFVAFCFRRPVVGLLTSFYIGFFLGGLGRWGPPSVPFGLSVDILLTVSLVGLLFTSKRTEAARLHSPLVYMLLIWLAYTILELANPEARNREAWFYAVRSFSFYWLQVTLIALITTRQVNDIERVVRIWLWCSAVLVFWGFEQQYIGLLGADQRWIDEWGYNTHVLMGHLRSFSFCSDAGQFGAAMAHVSLFTLIQAFNAPKWSTKLWLGVLGGIYFWGYAIAGSRGPVVILGLGFVIYILLRRNFFAFTLGAVCVVGAFGLLKFTSAGQSNYQVQRIRSSLDPNDPSLQLRLANQQAFAQYMQSRPFGAGMGMAGETGKRFGSNSILTERGIDSWYVRIWVETGVIGLVIHVLALLLPVFLGYRRVTRLKNRRLQSIMEGLLAGYVGILGASYGNMILGQFPTNLIMYMSAVFFMICPLLDTDNTVAESVPPSSI